MRPSGVEVRMADSLPMKLAVFDGQRGMLALLDPVITRPTWTAVVFQHEGMGEAMKGLFEDHWRRGRSLEYRRLALTRAAGDAALLAR